ncbi:MAG: restriction endonuclease subunit S [Pirellulales bacterium]
MSEENGRQLPPGWAWATLSEYAEIATGTTPRRSDSGYWHGGMIPWVTSTAVNEPFVRQGNEFVTQLALDETNLKIYPVHTLIVALYGEGKTRGKVSELLIDATVNQALGTIRLTGPVAEFRPFVKFYLQSRYENLRRKAAGGMQPNLNLGILKTIETPIAPLNEQRRIVAKIEELFSDLDAGVAALERAQANLKRYRASVLKAAVEGSLTAQWREQNPEDVEPASELLERILTERRERWEAEQLATYEAKGKKPPKGWKDKYKPPAEPDVSKLPELPEGWCWVTVEQVGEVQLGRQRSPKNRSKEYPTSYLRAANITEEGIDLSDVLDMEFTPRELERYRLSKGDIVVSEASGSPDQVGKPAVWNDELPKCCFQNTVIRIRPYVVASDYLLVFFKHCYTNSVFARVAAGVGINHLSAAKFSMIPVALAPLEEQRVLVDEVESLLSVIRQSDEILDATAARSSRLRQAILKRAFEGKLVPQDPNDEPASELLERIVADRSQSNQPVGRAKRTTKRKVRVTE